jgi:glycosyltransferase involved in cell wall biosynthesis
MKITWSVPVRGETMDSTRGDVVRAWSLIRALRADGHEVLVVEDSNAIVARTTVKAYRGIVRRILPRAVALVLRDLGRVLHARRHARRVIAAARDQGSELLIETQVHFAGSGEAAARATGLPLILDDCSPPGEELVLGASLVWLARRVFERQTEAATRVVVPTSRMREILSRERVPVEKLSLIPNGVDLEAHALARRKIIRIDRRKVVIVFVGSFQPWHRVDLLVEAFARLPETSPVELLLLGDGPGRAPALEHARHLGCAHRVFAPGAKQPSVVPDILARCDIGVLPASTEYAHPMKLIDYAAASLAALAPDISPVREVLEHGLTGLLFRADDVDALTDALHLLVRDPDLRSKLGAKAHARVAQQSSWTSRARMLLSEVCPSLNHGMEIARPAAGDVVALS